MSAGGLLAQKSKNKYGPRKDRRNLIRNETFSKIQKYISPHAIIESDQNKHYPRSIKTYFPKANFRQYKGRRGCVVGYGELKSGGFDPLFSINHSCAMLRDNLNRLKRKTWATTKKEQQLQRHLTLYSIFHNLNLTYIFFS